MKWALRHSLHAAILAMLASCSLFDYSGIVSHKYALVYGVSRYTMAKPAAPDPARGPNLQFPDADASSIYAVLSANGYTVKGRWVDISGEVWKDGVDTTHTIGSPVATSPDGSTYSGGDPLGDPLAPTKTNILTDMAALAGTIGPDDVLVVYFSGHGTQDASVDPPREYFDPYASVLDDTNGNFFDYPVPSVRDDDLRAAFGAMSTPRKVLILDTCNSGGFVGNTLESDWTPPAYVNGPAFASLATLAAAISNYASMESSPTGLSPYGAQVLAAAGRDELSYETPDYGHGVMSYFLLKGLQGAADLNNDGAITVLEAFAYAKAGVEENWNPAVGSAEAFEPHVSGGPVDFVLF
jgi:hypothetical protein